MSMEIQCNHPCLPAFSQGPPSLGLGNTHITIDALRLIKLTARTSAVMKSSEAGDLHQHDALISVFSTFGHLNRIQVSTSLSIVAQAALSVIKCVIQPL